jgi:hypothetical protein
MSAGARTAFPPAWPDERSRCPPSSPKPALTQRHAACDKARSVAALRAARNRCPPPGIAASSATPLTPSGSRTRTARRPSCSARLSLAMAMWLWHTFDTAGEFRSRPSSERFLRCTCHYAALPPRSRRRSAVEFASSIESVPEPSFSVRGWPTNACARSVCWSFLPQSPPPRAGPGGCLAAHTLELLE